MEKLKIAFSFIKIKLNKIGNILLKATTGYAVGSFALIQVSSIVSDNISMAEAFGLTKESFMQYLFVSLIIIFPIFLIITYILRSKSVDKEIMSTLDNNLSKIEDYRPKIAVIPFENLNQDKDQQFLVDGIAEDLLMELSMVKELSVATRKTCFDFKNKDYTSKEFKDEYGFDYIVTGSIRASDNKLRILIELSDMTDDRVIWTNKFDSASSDIFEIQDEIVTKIVTCLVGEIEISSLKRAHRKPTDNMTSYEYTLKGRALNQQFEKNANAEAIKMLDAAIEADTTNPLPYSWKACTIGQSMALGFREDNDETMADFLSALSKANELNDNDWNALRIIAEAHLTLDDFQQAMVYANKAYNANPNHPYVLWIYGRVLIRYNHTDDGIKVLEHLFKIEPMALADVNTDRVVKELFVAYYLSGNYKKCNELFNQIYEHDFREWLIYIDIKSKENIDYLKDVWFKSGLERFKDLNNKKEVSLFHFNNKKLNSSLLSLSNNLLT
jgi:TolB-like protein